MNLPVVSEAQEQEQRSIREFRNVMEDGSFIVRDVRESDYGVDMTLEIGDTNGYLSLEFGGYIIRGFTDSGSNNIGLNEFISAYQKLKAYQVQIMCRETGDVLFYMAVDNKGYDLPGKGHNNRKKNREVELCRPIN